MQHWRYIQRTSMLALASFWFASTGQAQNATSYQIDPAHDGALTTTAPFQPPLKQLWSVAFSAPLVSYPVIAQDMVFINCNTSLYALSAKTGAILWQKQIVNSSDTSFFMAYDNGRIYELSNSGILSAFDPKTGTSIWSTQVPDQYSFTTPPVAFDGYVYFTGGEGVGNIYKYAESTGNLVWSSYFSGGGIPAVNKAQVFVNGGNVYAFDIRTGFLNWQNSTFIAYGGDNSIGLYSDKLIASSAVLSPETGIVAGLIGGGVQAFYGNLALQNQTDVLSATDLTSGTIAWSFTRSGNSSFAPPIIINGTVYSLSNEGILYAVDAKTGRLLQSLNTHGGSNPGSGAYGEPYLGLAAGQGILVVPSTKTLVAYGP